MEAALQAAQEQATDMAGGQNSELYAELGSVIAAKDALEAELLSQNWAMESLRTS